MSITKQVEKYVSEHPSIKDCLKSGLVNYSSLARLISKELSLDVKEHFDALLIACRRTQEKVKREPSSAGKVIEILKKSKIEIKNKATVFILEKSAPDRTLLELEHRIKKQEEIFHLIEGPSAMTLITTEDFSKDIRASLKNHILSEKKGLVEVVLKSSKDIENTAGTIGHLYSLLGENGVNIVETMSCWTDTIFLVSEKDLGKVMDLLRF